MVVGKIAATTGKWINGKWVKEAAKTLETGKVYTKMQPIELRTSEKLLDEVFPSVNLSSETAKATIVRESTTKPMRVKTTMASEATTEPSVVKPMKINKINFTTDELCAEKQILKKSDFEKWFIIRYKDGSLLYQDKLTGDYIFYDESNRIVRCLSDKTLAELEEKINLDGTKTIIRRSSKI